MRIDNRAHVPWLIFVVLATLFATWLYLGNFAPNQLPAGLGLPRQLMQQPSQHRSVGGTPLGLTFGAVAFGIFIFAGVLGVRKKFVLWRIGTVQSWMRAHIWLTLLTVPLVILHSGFRLGGEMTTLLVILYLIVMVSGIYGLALQNRMPHMMMERLPSEIVSEQIPHIRSRLYVAAKKLRESLKLAPVVAMEAVGSPGWSHAGTSGRFNRLGRGRSVRGDAGRISGPAGSPVSQRSKRKKISAWKGAFLGRHVSISSTSRGRDLPGPGSGNPKLV